MPYDRRVEGKKMTDGELTEEQLKILEDWGLEVVRLKLYTPVGSMSGPHVPHKIRVGLDELPRNIIEQWLFNKSKKESRKSFYYNISTFIAALVAAVAAVWQLIISL